MPDAPRMKAQAAWAAVSKDGNVIGVNTRKDALEACWHPGPDKLAVRLARVTITEGDGWQEIESAPRDGTDVLVISLYRPEAHPHDYDIAFYQDGRWRTYIDESTIEPTNWRPLPEPPAQGKGK